MALADDHAVQRVREVSGQVAFELDPVVRAGSQHVRRVEPLGHDAFQSVRDDILEQRGQRVCRVGDPRLGDEDRVPRGTMRRSSWPR